MKTIRWILAAAGILASVAGYAQSGADLVKAKGCLNCHEMDKKKVGPAFKELAAKYKDDKGAAATLSAKLKEGKPHPPIAASDAEIKAMVQYVLSRK